MSAALERDALEHRRGTRVVDVPQGVHGPGAGVVGPPVLGLAQQSLQGLTNAGPHQHAEPRVDLDRLGPGFEG